MVHWTRFLKHHSPAKTYIIGIVLCIFTLGISYRNNAPVWEFPKICPSAALYTMEVLFAFASNLARSPVSLINFFNSSSCSIILTASNRLLLQLKYNTNRKSLFLHTNWNEQYF